MSFRFLLRPKWIFWSTVVVVACVVMVNLAQWQWDRLGERQERNVQIMDRAQLASVDVESLLVGLDYDEAEELVWRRVMAQGVYDATTQVLVPNRTLDGMPGSWVITLLRVDDATAVAVNRGWVPISVTAEEAVDIYAPPEGTVVVEGLLQPTQARSAGPVDDPRSIPRVNLALLDERIDAAVLPAWIQLEAQAPAVDAASPQPLPPPGLDEGPHLSYAGQWLIFTTLTLVIYGVLVVRTARSGGDGPPSPEQPERRSGPARDHGSSVAPQPALRAPVGSPSSSEGASQPHG